MESQLHLVVGLGNPGSEYDRTRHNIGFALLDRLYASLTPAHLTSPPWRSKFGGLLAEFNGDRSRTLLLKPQTFMNRSGDSVQQCAAFYKLTPEQVFVVHDDLDLPLGAVRLKKGGGDGGHNGLRSVSSALGPDYYRIRLGVGRPVATPEVLDRQEPRIVQWVLGRVSRGEEPLAAEMVERGVEALRALWSDGLSSAQNRFHRG
jgi:PTH1 family peptidyl-tRNA hydrolase